MSARRRFVSVLKSATAVGTAVEFRVLGFAFRGVSSNFHFQKLETKNPKLETNFL